MCQIKWSVPLIELYMGTTDSVMVPQTECLLWGQTRKSRDVIATSVLPLAADIPPSGF
jgi:hypothetical protein